MPTISLVRCDACGVDVKANGFSGHQRSKVHLANLGSSSTTPSLLRAEEPEAVVPPSLGATALGEPAILPEWRPTGRLRSQQRSIKMLRPICAICQGADNPVWNWWATCPHDPYVTVRRVVTEVPQYEDLGNGRFRQTGVSTEVEWVPRPNRQESTLSMKVNSGLAVERNRRNKGFIFPSELRSKHYPFGIADPCEYHSCYQQVGLTSYGRWGRYCRPEEASLVILQEDEGAANLIGGYLEVNDPRKRAIQLRQVLQLA